MARAPRRRQLSAARPDDAAGMRSPAAVEMRLPIRLGRALAGLGYQSVGAERGRFRDVYFDSQGGDLYKAGARLRLRQPAGVWQLLMGSAIVTECAERPHRRAEELLQTALEPLTRGTRLFEQLAVESRETARLLEREGGGKVYLVRRQCRFARTVGQPWVSARGGWSIAAAAGYDAEADIVGTVLRDLGKVRLGVNDPLVEGLELLELPLPGAPLPRSLRLAATDSIAVAASKVVRGQGFKMWANTEGTEADLDPEFLHDLRVATRRCRQALRLFGDALSQLDARQVVGELSWIAGLLGEVRDLDVFAERMRADLIRIASVDAVRAAVVGALDAERAPKLDALRTAIASARYGKLLGFLRDCLPSEMGAPATLARVAAGTLIRRQTRKLRKLVDAAETDPSDQQLHRTRISFKKLRYTLEFFSDLLTDEAQAVVRTLIGFQDCLGAHQDAVVGLAKLEALMPALVDGARLQGPSMLLSLGALMQLQRERAARERASFLERRAKLPKTLKKLVSALE